MLKKVHEIREESLTEAFNASADLEIRHIRVCGSIELLLTYIDGLCSSVTAAEDVIRPLMSLEDCIDEGSAMERLEKSVVYAPSVKSCEKLSELVGDMLNGRIAIIFPKLGKALTFEVKSTEKRAVSEPKEEKVMKGGRDAFVETLRTNTALVRKRIKSEKLTVRPLKVGKQTNTDVAVIYIDGFTDINFVKEAEKRIGSIKNSDLISSATIVENISDHPNSPFPQVITTERPDKFALNLVEGRVGILVDGLPLGYLVPGTFTQFLKVPEDQASHYAIASILTALRYFCLALSLLTPAFYVAIVMYHQEMIPIRLMSSIIDAKISVPFPTAVEVLTMLISFELLQEAGLRLAAPVGQTVSIIGALIVGQSAVEAKVVSPVVVVAIALAGIAGYTIPDQDMASAVRIFRFVLVLMSITLGMFGLAIGVALIIWGLASMDSFGVAYLTPFAGSRGRYIKRAIFRISMRKKRDREPELTERRER